MVANLFPYPPLIPLYDSTWRIHSLYSQWWLARIQWPLQKIHCLHRKCSKTLQACLLWACMFLNTLGSWDYTTWSLWILLQETISRGSYFESPSAGSQLVYQTSLGYWSTNRKISKWDMVMWRVSTAQSRETTSPLWMDRNQNHQEKDIYLQIRLLQIAGERAESSMEDLYSIPSITYLLKSYFKFYEYNTLSWEGNTISQWFLFYKKILNFISWIPQHF